PRSTLFPYTTLFRSQRHLDGVAHADVDFAFFVAELLDRDNALGLQAGVDDDHVGADVDHGAGDDGAGLELGEVGLALFEEFGEGFGGYGHVVLGWRAGLQRRGWWIARVRPGPSGTSR